ncbi:HDOD domain-containing protein [Desulfopila aestuarii]|uniref:histidine kinase n=1 Tax=Desulfopila aestuarii DSM 18488 TaxID=1121416 RepID=A0A1M7YER1_9BACT|nr:HDOD domain-containing protein [Desulfopila aestuarii]SHO51069.1 HDIG domain-containing protein [Desulfopila aestuarii DSM 18488]
MSSTTPVPHQHLNLSKIPALPQTLIELLDACNDPEVNIYGVGELVARDSVISGRILQLANSAFLGAKSAFGEIQQAVIYLGLDTVRNLAVCVSVHETFDANSNSAKINLPQFWYHSLLTAILAKNLAEKTAKASPAEAYLCGLLHDLGKLLLASGYPDDYERLLTSVPQGKTFTESEQHYFGIHHGDVGSSLIHHWKLPEHLAKAIALHHTHSVNGSENPLVDIIHLANSLSHIPDEDGNIPPLPLSILLGKKELRAVLTASQASVDEIARALGIKVEKGVDSAAKHQKTTKDDSLRQELQEKTRQMMVLHGAIDNLLKAENQDRICQILEETLMLLAELRHAFLLLPQDGTKDLSVAISAANPLRQHLADIPIPDCSSSSIIHQCIDNAIICHTGPDRTTRSEADSRLTAFLNCEQLLAIPLPLADTERGALVLGLRSYQADQLGVHNNSLSFLASHVGARLSLEQLSRRMSSELIHKELTGVEKVTRAIAHEISNPLAVIQNYLVVLERKIGNGDNPAQDLQLIGDEIGRISTIARQLENLTDLTRRPTGKSMRLDHILRDTLTFFRESLFSRKNIEVQVRLEPETRSLVAPVEILRQVLAILFANAADAMPDGGRIEIGSSLADTGQPYSEKILAISVCDNGPGIPEEMRPTIFNAGVTTKTEGHLGLGLSIARKLLLDREGTIGCTPAPGRGTCFTIRLPISD